MIGAGLSGVFQKQKEMAVWARDISGVREGRLQGGRHFGQGEREGVLNKKHC